MYADGLPLYRQEASDGGRAAVIYFASLLCSRRLQVALMDLKPRLSPCSGGIFAKSWFSLDNDPTPSFEQRPTIANPTGLSNTYF